MEKKVCKKCNQLKSITEFHLAKKHKDGYRNDCKSCVSNYQKIHFKKLPSSTKKMYSINANIRKRGRHKKYLIVFIRRMYNYMQSRVRGQVVIDRDKYRRYIGLPICDRKAFILFAFKNWRLKQIFHEWKRKNYPKNLLPTVDRIENDKGYVLENIQFLTWRENIAKRWEDGRLRKF